MRYLPVLLMLAMPPLGAAELEIVDAWIKQLPASVPVRAGYLTLYNPGSETRSLRRVESERFARVEIHRTVETDGMMSMQPVDELRVEPGARARLEPGGIHLMMMQPVAPTQPGEVVEVRLYFADGSKQSLQMVVKQ